MDKSLTPKQKANQLTALVRQWRESGIYRRYLNVPAQKIKTDQSGVFALMNASGRLTDQQLRGLEVFVKQCARWPEMKPYFVEKTAGEVGIDKEILFKLKRHVNNG